VAKTSCDHRRSTYLLKIEKKNRGDELEISVNELIHLSSTRVHKHRFKENDAISRVW
jgi:hypothetical protein